MKLLITFFFFHSQQITALTQESHLEKLALSRNVVINQLDTTKAVIDGTSQVTATAQSVATTIPQDITTMSDHDLISYINPSCFDMWCNEQENKRESLY